jgi:hypothetical protein
MLQMLKRLKNLFNSEIYSELHGMRVSSGRVEILASKAGRDSFVDLWDAEVKVFSQWGEDGILWFLCDVLEISKPRILEIGSGNFTECNSRFLAEARNAAVFLVDSRSDLISELSKLDLLWKNNISALETWVTPSNANSIACQARKQLGSIDILSLDIDGIDYWVMSEIDLSQISIIVVEYNPTFGSRYAFTVPKSESFDRTTAHYSWLYFGVSLRAWVDFFERKEFMFVGTDRVGNNAFFVSRMSDEIFKYINRPDATLEKYVDWQVRESRDEHGRLNYLDLESARSSIQECEISRISQNQIITSCTIRSLGNLTFE